MAFDAAQCNCDPRTNPVDKKKGKEEESCVMGIVGPTLDPFIAYLILYVDYETQLHWYPL